MGESFGVYVVDCLNKLLGIVAHDGFSKRARVCYVVKQFASWYKFLNDICHTDRLAVFLGHNGICVELEVFDDVAMIEVSYRSDFVLQKLKSSLVEVGVVEAENFDGALCSVLGCTKFDFGTEPGAESFAEGVASKSCSHS